jgi:hypothetical protein
VLSARTVLALVLVGLAACAPEPAAAPSPAQPSDPADAATALAPPAPSPPSPPAPPPEPSPAPPARPAWLGTRVLPLRPDGFGEVRPTPPELRDRRLPPSEALPPTDVATIAEVPPEVAARSTWSPECPVALEELRYLTVPFWGFDDLPHTGELVVHASVAEDVAAVFARLYDARFPLEQVRIVSRPQLDLPPTGDGNTTSGFVCRPVTGGSGWSQHAYGLAVDVNPFHNPYTRGDLVVPELASAYLDRDDQRPGMVTAEVRDAFEDIGWGWGGAWNSSKDYMHFSASGR